MAEYLPNRESGEVNIPKGVSVKRDRIPVDGGCGWENADEKNADRAIFV